MHLRLNTHISHPEIVLVGPVSHGKSSLLEAVLGKQFNHIGLGMSLNKAKLSNIANTRS